MKTHLIAGAGNTFHITWSASLQKRGQLGGVAAEACRIYSADGFIFLSYNSDEQKYEWDFYNNDGSRAEMCGNASRCVAYYHEHILKNPQKKINLQTQAGLIHIDILGQCTYKVQMTPIVHFENKNYFFCDTGVPHVVLSVASIKTAQDYKQQCQQIRFSAEFAPRGTNVTLIEKQQADDTLAAVTYERGVENFTPACGTGAMAAAYYNLVKSRQKKTNVFMPGGQLIMDVTDLNKPTMQGTAQLQGEYEYTDEHRHKL